MYWPEIDWILWKEKVRGKRGKWLLRHFPDGKGVSFACRQMSKLLIAKVRPMSTSEFLESYSYAVASTRLALPLPPPLSVDTSTSVQTFIFPWEEELQNPEKVPVALVAEIGVDSNSNAGSPHPSSFPAFPLTAFTFALSCMRADQG